MEVQHGQSKDVTAPSAPAPAAAPSTPAPESAAATAPTGTPEAPKIESSPVAQKAREVLDNAKKGIFPEKKETKETKKEGQPDSKGEPKEKEAAAKDAATPPPTTPPAYVPNHKYKVSGVEKEFDEAIKALIKDKDTEEKVRKLYADAAGVVPLKRDFDRISAQHKEVNEKYTLLDRDIRLLSHHVKNQDFDSFFGDLQIPQEAVFSWVEQKLKEMELPQPMQEQLERQRNVSRKAFLLQEENQGYQQSAQHQQVQARTYELDTELLKPEVAQVAQDFDARVGRPGAFRDECMHRGALAWHIGKKDISATEAVGQVMSLIGRVISPAPQAPQAPATGQQPPQVPSNAQPASTATAPVLPPPTIPNMSGSTTSPIRQAPKSIADLRQMAKNFPAAR